MAQKRRIGVIAALLCLPITVITLDIVRTVNEVSALLQTGGTLSLEQIYVWRIIESSVAVIFPSCLGYYRPAHGLVLRVKQYFSKGEMSTNPSMSPPHQSADATFVQRQNSCEKLDHENGSINEPQPRRPIDLGGRVLVSVRDIESSVPARDAQSSFSLNDIGEWSDSIRWSPLVSDIESPRSLA